MSLVDSHCHLDASQFSADRDEVIQRAFDAGVLRMLTVGTGEGPPDLEAGIRLAERYEFLLATAGIHPEYASKVTLDDYKHLADVLRHPKCVALGEVGIDYHWEPFDARQQASVFIEQMRIAAEARKPIIIHTRDAWQDTIALLREHWIPTALPCVMHCFTGTPEQAAEVLDLGFYVSLAGVVTYPKALELQEAARLIPLDRLLVETDAPYLPPVPYRGKRNEPAWVVHTARKVAELKGTDCETVGQSVVANFERLFTRQLH